MKNLAEIRRKNLAALVDEFGLTSVAKRMGRSVNQISDTIAGRKSFGEKVARSMEESWDASLRPGWLDDGIEAQEKERIFSIEQQNTPPDGYIRLEHLPHQPSMGKGRVQNVDHIVQHIDVLETFVRQKIGTTNPERVKILTGVGTSMAPVIQDQDIVFVDIEHRWIDAPGYYVLDVAGLLLLKKAMILSTGTLILRSENTSEFPDEERHDLRTVAETITVCGKVLAWWTLKKG